MNVNSDTRAALILGFLSAALIAVGQAEELLEGNSPETLSLHKELSEIVAAFEEPTKKLLALTSIKENK